MSVSAVLWIVTHQHKHGVMFDWLNWYCHCCLQMYWSPLSFSQPQSVDLETCVNWVWSGVRLLSVAVEMCHTLWLPLHVCLDLVTVRSSVVVQWRPSLPLSPRLHSLWMEVLVWSMTLLSVLVPTPVLCSVWTSQVGLILCVYIIEVDCMCTTATSSSGVESSFNYIYNIMTLDVDAVNVTWGRYFVSFPSTTCFIMIKISSGSW